MPRSRRRAGAKRKLAQQRAHRTHITLDAMPRRYYDPGADPKPRRPAVMPTVHWPQSR